MNKEVIYQGNSIISVENLPDYSKPVVIKKLAKPHASRRKILSLEKEFEMTRALDAVEGVRKALERQSIENQPVLILEYVDGKPCGTMSPEKHSICVQNLKSPSI